MKSRRWLAACAGFVFATVGSQPVLAQESGFLLELNNAHDMNGTCRLVFVAMNRTDAILEKTAYEVAVFDDQQKVSQILVLEFGRVPIGKTKVVQFDLANQACSKISRLLVNDIADCVVAGQPSTICLDALKADTRTEIGFGL